VWMQEIVVPCHVRSVRACPILPLRLLK
jgi:hypothetical protein